jgi:hypothetical protein
VVGIFLISGGSPSIPMLQVPARMFSDLFSALKKPAVSVVALMIAAGTASTMAFFPKDGTRPQRSRLNPPRLCRCVVQTATN